MRVQVSHATHYTYNPAAERAALRLKLFPAQFASQRVLSWKVSVNGREAPALLTNGYGDAETIWTQQGACETIDILAEGVIETIDTAGVVKGLYEAARPGVFLRHSPLTLQTKEIQDLAKTAQQPTPLESMHALSAAVATAIRYTSGATHAGQSAAEALALGKGVCQDQSHVFIAAARSLGIPARYVVGYLTGGVESQSDTHAWVEAYIPDLGWVGFDPVNAQCPTDAYVRLASGFDASDAAPVRGCFSPVVSESLSTRVQFDLDDQMRQSQTQ